MTTTALAKYWADYYTRKNAFVSSTQVHKIGRKDRNGFQRYRVIVNVHPHHAYVFDFYSA